MQAQASLSTQWGLTHPLIQAPMAGVSTPQLAAAVSNTGALGALGIGASSLAQAREMITATRALTARPFLVNVFCHRPAQRDKLREAAWLDYLAPLFAACEAPVPTVLEEIYPSFLTDDRYLQLLLELRPAVLSFHFGLPSAAQLQAIHQAGIQTVASATHLAEAQQIERAGIGAVVAQGIEAGGHRGCFDPQAADEALSTADLVRILVAQTRLPVIAAGGIMHGRDIQAMLGLGAAAVQLGTAFVLCPESSANAAYRAHLQQGAGLETQLTAALSGRPARALVNRLVSYGEAANRPVLPDYPVLYDATKRLCAAAARAEQPGFGVHWAGQGAAQARALPAAQLVQQLLDEWAATQRNGE